MDPGQCDLIRDALMQFGLGCQLLDDLRDMARDLNERRHNNVLSLMAHTDQDRLAALAKEGPDRESRLYLSVPGVAASTANRAVGMLRES